MPSLFTSSCVFLSGRKQEKEGKKEKDTNKLPWYYCPQLLSPLAQFKYWDQWTCSQFFTCSTSTITWPSQPTLKKTTSSVPNWHSHSAALIIILHGCLTADHLLLKLCLDLSLLSQPLAALFQSSLLTCHQQADSLWDSSAVLSNSQRCFSLSSHPFWALDTCLIMYHI